MSTKSSRSFANRPTDMTISAILGPNPLTRNIEAASSTLAGCLMRLSIAIFRFFPKLLGRCDAGSSSHVFSPTPSSYRLRTSLRDGFERRRNAVRGGRCVRA